MGKEKSVEYLKQTYDRNVIRNKDKIHHQIKELCNETLTDKTSGNRLTCYFLCLSCKSTVTIAVAQQTDNNLKLTSLLAMNLNKMINEQNNPFMLFSERKTTIFISC